MWQSSLLIGSPYICIAVSNYALGCEGKETIMLIGRRPINYSVIRNSLLGCKERFAVVREFDLTLSNLTLSVLISVVYEVDMNTNKTFTRIQSDYEIMALHLDFMQANQPVCSRHLV